VKISNDGSPPKDGRLRLNSSIAPWFLVKDAASLGTVSALLGRPFSLGWQPLVRSLSWIISGSGTSLRCTDDACVRRIKSLWTIFFFIVMWLMTRGLLF
jgi:hypothetical protein